MLEQLPSKRAKFYYIKRSKDASMKGERHLTERIMLSAFCEIKAMIKLIPSDKTALRDQSAQVMVRSEEALGRNSDRSAGSCFTYSHLQDTFSYWQCLLGDLNNYKIN